MTDHSAGDSSGNQDPAHGDPARSARSATPHPETVAIEATGVVLAGGESQRFRDGDKALAELDGEPLVRRVVSAVTAAHERPPVVAVKEASQREHLAAVLETDEPAFVRDTRGFQGPVAGVDAAVRAVSVPWFFLTGCDMPRLSPAAIAWLSGYCTTDVDAVVLTAEGHPQPLHSFYSRSSVRDAMERLPPQAGVRALLERLPTCRRVPASAAPAAIPVAASIRNVNTRAELQRLRA